MVERRKPSVSPKRSSVGPKRAGAAAVSTQPKAKTFPYEFKTAQERARATLRAPDMSTKDPLLQHMIKNIETIAQPKMVCGASDWLKTQNETGQTIAQYQQGGPNITWMSARQNVIYLFIIDNSIDEETCNKMRQYTEAFYLGCPVKLVRQGQQIYSQKSGNRTETKSLPEDFVATHNITRR